MGAKVRFFCVVGPRAAAAFEGLWWPDLSWVYLQAFVDRGVDAHVRALPIGGAYLAIDERDPASRHWSSVQHMFSQQLDDDWETNIVCAPARFPLGQRLRRGDLSPTRVPELENMAPGHPGSGSPAVSQMTQVAAVADPNEPMYEPSTALSTLWVEPPRRNIAITDVLPQPPDDHEAWTLAHRYDQIVAVRPRAARALTLLDLGKCVSIRGPHDLVSELADGGWV